ncbi:MAG: cytochrome c oxidase accessory protein CcoG [Curvibacter sp.]|nr:cytochrome c oxidase accessory protein CcoG [Curvibacter sp.]
MSSNPGPSAHVLHFHPPVAQPLKFGIREIQGRFNRYRGLSIGLTQALYFGLCWAHWDGHPLLGFDFVRQRVHLFGALYGPQDLLLLALLLIAGALALFTASAIAGRIFCGFACPQSVYTAAFLWLEQRCQGSPGRRQRLWREGRRAERLLRRTATWAAWALLSLAVGWTLVAYFSSAPDLWSRTWQARLSPLEWTGLLGYAAFTFLQAGLLRESVCQHMCPYARFQGVMGHASTQVVGYDAPRGEPRASTITTARTSGSGACIDCGLCVEVCPAGIDIRQGAQYACISCGLCIDACERVMQRSRQPGGLIRFAAADGSGLKQTLSQPRIRLYLGLLALCGLGVAVLAATRVPLQLEVLRDRGVLSRQRADGLQENVYRLHVQNYDLRAHAYALELQGPPGLRLAQDLTPTLYIESGGERSIAVRVLAPADAVAEGQAPNPAPSAVLPLQFRLRALDAPAQQRQQASTFLWSRAG